MNKLTKHLQSNPLLLWLYFFISSILIFTLVRAVLLINISLRNITGLNEATPGNLAFAFIVGLRFDIAIISIILAIPILVSIYLYLRNQADYLQIHVKMIKGSLAVILLCILISLFDLEFWPYFSQRLNAEVFQWLGTPDMAIGIVFGSYPIFSYTFAWMVSAYALTKIFNFGLAKIIDKYSFSSKDTTNGVVVSGLKFRISISIILLFFVVLGIRGRIEPKSPLRTGHAFFSDQYVPNQLALNSVFSLAHSASNELKDSSYPYTKLSIKDANTNLSNYFFENKKKEISKQNGTQKTLFSQNKNNNIILILGESMSAQLIKSLSGHNDPNVSVELDKIIAKSLTFNEFHSNNIHTGHGLFNVISGLPNPPGVSITKTRFGEIKRRSWIKILNELGYETLFFTTHDPHFDNMHGFAIANGFRRVLSNHDYKEKAVGPLGVFDHVMLDEALLRFEKLHKDKKKFAAVLLTGTNHGPYVLPDPLPFPKLKSRNPYRYMDWAIGRFYKTFKKSPYAKKTFLIITGDHGLNYQYIKRDVGYPYGWHHIPLIIHKESDHAFNKKKINSTLGSQIDLPATILDLLGVSFENNTMGVSLFQKRRAQEIAPVVIYQRMGLYSRDNFISIEEGSKPKLYLFNQNKSAVDIPAKVKLLNSFYRVTKGRIENRSKQAKNKIEK